MQVQKINTTSFQAKVKVEIGEDFISRLSMEPPSSVAKFVDETIAAVKVLKEVAPKIGSDEDKIILRSYKSKELDLFYGDSFEGIVGNFVEKPLEGVIVCLKLLTDRLKIQNDSLLNFRKFVRNPFASMIFKDNKLKQYPKVGHEQIAEFFGISKSTSVEESLEKLRQLNKND